MKAQVDEFLRFVAVEKGYSNHTVAAYRNDLTQFLGYLADVSVTSWADVNRTHILNYVLFLKNRRYARSTVARKMAAVKSYFHFLVADGVLRDDPTATVDSPPVEKRIPRPLSPGEMSRLLAVEAQSSAPRDLRDRALLELMYATGMRASEVIQLEVTALDLDDGTVRCLGKGSRERILPLYARAVEVLRQYLNHGRDELIRRKDEQALFVNHRGGPLTRQGLWLIVKERAAAAGIEREVTPHMLRHSFATHLLDGGAGLREVQHLLGHANISSTQIYTKVSSRRRRKVYDETHPRA
jgi:integrase/recombinase XerD